MTKLHDEINGMTHFGQKPFAYGKAKVSEGVNLWAGKWKIITGISGTNFSLDGRGFNIKEIDEVRLTREGFIKLLDEGNIS